ncbi:hypothetical protein Z583_03799, partial [Mycobacterium tuberculosis variant bovis Bz 31150]
CGVARIAPGDYAAACLGFSQPTTHIEKYCEPLQVLP